jgi:hypothetical protein
MKIPFLCLLLMAASLGISGCGAVQTNHSLLAAIPKSVVFSNVALGTSNSQTIKITNSGSTTLTLNSATITGTGFSIAGLAAPANLDAGESTTFNVLFAPKSAGPVSGRITLISDDPNSPELIITLAGMGVLSDAKLQANPSSLDFISVTVGNSVQQTVTISNTGNTDVTISSAGVNADGFSITGLAASITAPITLIAGQNLPLSVEFTPNRAERFSGSITVASNAPAIGVSLVGTGVEAGSHAAILNWTASTTSTVVGYNVYRASTTGGPYSKLNSSSLAGLTFTDSTVVPGQTYFYVLTAMDSSGIESAITVEVSGMIPTP